MKKTRSMNHTNQRSAILRSLLITAVYAFAGYAWIILSDFAVANAHSESPEVLFISVLKGLFYVTATAVLTFLLVYSNLKKIIREIDERRTSENALKEAQQLAQIGSFSYNSNTNELKCSEEAMRILNISENPVISDYSQLLHRVHTEDRERIITTVHQTLNVGGDASFYCRLLQGDSGGRTLNVRIHASFQKDHVHTLFFGTMQDVSDRVQAETAARENEAIYKALINSSYDLVYLKDSSLRYIAANSNMQHYYGFSEDELLGKTADEVFSSEESKSWEARDRSVLMSDAPLYIEDTKDGRTFETIIFPVDMTGNKRGVGGISRDITQRRLTEAAVEEERDRAQAYFEIASVIFIVLDRNADTLMINRAGCDALQLPKDQIIGQNWIKRFVPESEQPDLSELMSRLQENDSNAHQTHENNIITASNELRRIEWRNTILKNADGTFRGILATGVDVTELRQAIQALQESERSKSVLLSNLPGMAYRCANDRYWTMQFISNGCFELTGYLPEELIDNACISFNDIICPEYRNFNVGDKIGSKSPRVGNRFEYEIMTASGERKWVLDISQSIRDDHDAIIAFEGIIIDITNSKLQFLQIQYLSNHDQLTGLYNRQYYDNAKKRLDNEKYLPLSVLFFDINGLKLINDAFGYDAGDRMIQATASLIKESVRPNEIIARIGGDEFVVLMPNTDELHCVARMQTIKEEFDSYNLSVKDRALVINLSSGCGTKRDEDMDIALIEKDAEANMARRKLFDQKSHHNAVLSSIMATLFERSYETEEHAERIGQLCAVIGERLGLSHDDIDKLRLFAILHDIGKIGISDQILNKPSALTEEEMAQMRMHPEIGYRIAMASPDFAPIAELILTHQERWDGTGYPNRIAGENIPLLSRILAVADAYDAMTKDRVYRKALPREEAIEEIRRNAGTQFDPQISNLFLEVLEQTNL